MTHADLVAATAHWLEKKKRYRVVLRDVQAVCVNEQPDVLGWRGSGASLLVECKATRSDFLRDAKKWFRREPSKGMGYERYYAAPPGVIFLDEVGSWGLLTVEAGKVRVVKKSGPFTRRNEQAERALLVSAVCRVTEGWGRKMFGPNAPLNPDGDPPKSMARVIRDLRNEVRELRMQLHERGDRR